MALKGGKTYVQASRNVITGDNPSQWRAQITIFFKELLNGLPSIDIDIIEGDTLTVSKKETAAKARDNYRTEQGKCVKMTDDEFRVKLHVDSHIDEIAKISSPSGAVLKKMQKVTPLQRMVLHTALRSWRILTDSITRCNFLLETTERSPLCITSVKQKRRSAFS